MKRFILTLASAITVALSANAQIGSSTSRTIKTHVEQEKYEISYSKTYFRFTIGGGPAITYVGGKSNGESFKNSSGGLGSVNGSLVVGWPTKVENLYLEAGLGIQTYFGTAESNYFKYEIEDFGTFEIPFNATYKIKAGDNIFIAPYAGCHFALNINDDTHLNMKKPETGYAERASDVGAGIQLGVNVEYKKFHVGLGWHKTFANYSKDSGLGGPHLEDTSTGVSDINIHVGYTFKKKKKVRIQ